MPLQISYIEILTSKEMILDDRIFERIDQEEQTLIKVLQEYTVSSLLLLRVNEKRAWLPSENQEARSH